MTSKQFIRVNSKFEGVQYDGTNRREIVGMLGIDKQHCELWLNQDTKIPHLNIVAPTCNLGRVEVSEWVLMAIDKKQAMVVPESDFKVEFEGV